jgi:hypothetical protein
VSGCCKDFFVADFLDKSVFLNFLKNLCDHEKTFTKTGLKFLEEYYGIDEVVKMLQEDDPSFPYDDSHSVKDYLYIKNIRD